MPNQFSRRQLLKNLGVACGGLLALLLTGYVDILAGGINIETKHWAYLTGHPKQLATQIAKDFYIMFKRIEVDGKRVVFDDGIVDNNPLLDSNGNVVFDGQNNAIHRVRYHDSKLTDGAPWSTNQNTEIIDKFTYHPVNNPNPPDYIDFEVRNNSDYFTEIFSPLEQGRTVRLYREDVFKSISNGNGQQIIETKKIF